jgi:putative hydrolase of the HAD superfamily
MSNKGQLLNTLKPLLPVETDLVPRGRPKNKVKALLFDIYGTLFISESGDISIAKKMSARKNQIKTLLEKFSIPDPPSLILDRIHAAIDDSHESLRKKGIDFPEVTIDRLWRKVLNLEDMTRVRAFAFEYEMIVNPVYPMPHLSEMLTGCKASPVLMGIISNAQFYTPHLFPLFLNRDLAHLGFHPSMILFSYQFEVAKPSLFLFQQAADRLKQEGISSDSVIYLGNDMLNDIYPAWKSGFQTALFAGDKRSLRLREDNPKCKDLKPDLVITDLSQILDHIRH